MTPPATWAAACRQSVGRCLRRLGAWYRTHSQTIAYTWLTLLFVGSVTFTQVNARQDCVDRRDARAGVRLTINTVKQIVEATGGPVDYTTVPGWNDLDPAMKEFLDNLTSGSSGSGSFREAALTNLNVALAALPPIECS